MEAQNPDAGTVIVGGGLAGMTAACYLARAGQHVTLIERTPVLGGRGTSQDYSGFQMNRGIHALYSGGEASEVLNELGVQYTGNSPSIVHALHDGEFYMAPITGRSVVTTSLFSMGEKFELVRLLIRIARMNPETVKEVSVQEWLDTNVNHPSVLSFLEANARTGVYSDALDLVSAELFIERTQTVLNNPVIYIDGGWKTLADGLRESAEAAGVTIHTNTEVAGVELDRGTVSGIRLKSGEKKDASSVVLATTPQQALALLPDDSSTQLADLVEGITPAHVACLTVALRRLPNSDYTVVQDLDQPRFMSIQSEYSNVAPEGGALIYAFKQLDPRNDDPRQDDEVRQDEHDLAELLDEAQPGWREVLIKRQFLPRIQAVGMLPTAEVSGYSSRPRPDVTDIQGLYVAGDWVGHGFLSDASFGSGREAARFILEPVVQGSSSQDAVSRSYAMDSSD